MAGGVIVRNDFRAFMATGLKVIFDENIKDMKEEFTDFFAMETSDKAYETELGFVGMGAPSYNAELDLPRMDAPRQGRPVTYIATKFGLGCAISFESKADDRYNKIANSIIPEIALSFKRERNTQAANLLNNAFTNMGYEPDGVPLISNAHPLVRGGTFSNLLTAPLSTAGLQAARTRLRKNLTESGKIQPLTGTTLIVPPSLESLAEELVKSTQKPGQTGAGAGGVTTPSEVNLPWQRGLKVVVMNYLTDSGQWFLCADKEYRKIKWFDRMKLTPTTIIDDEIQAIKFYSRARWSYGFSDWRGITGYPGS